MKTIGNILIALTFVILSSNVFAQENATVYWVSFSDKNNNEYSIDNPEEFLSQRSLDRRTNQNIDIDISDLPVSKYYIDSLESLNITVRYTSKWMNGAAIQSTDSQLIDTIENYGFITSKRLIRNEVPIVKSGKEIEDNFFDYGFSDNQISMLNGHILHNNGYTGSGMLIAVLDAGFSSVPVLSTLQHLILNDKIIATKDFVKGGIVEYSKHSHGRNVLTIIAAKEEGRLIGSAPDADYILVRTEDAGSEQVIEEYNWLAGAEYADSLGVDVINVSLGYREYDNPEWTYDANEIDG
ncbi:MAG: S8 family serine peptidase, partial [Bacteroidales bacterium]|nr:S8 family serine peptidase [Bacteroidales bacterium]